MDGIFGIFNPDNKDIVNNSFLGLGAIQNRGKPSTGFAFLNNEGIFIKKDLGRIIDILTSENMKIFNSLHPYAAIGNVGYTKNVASEYRNTEPIRIFDKENKNLEIVLTMDGHLVKSAVNELKHELESEYKFKTGNVTEIVGSLFHNYINKEGICFSAGKKFIDKLHGKGTFAVNSLVFDRKKKEGYLISINDDKAFEPFCFGKINDSFITSSESDSHRTLGGYKQRDFNGAEMIIASNKGIKLHRLREETEMPAMFQIVYFGSPASYFRGKQLYDWRMQLGYILADLYRNSSTKADIVIPNPDSGRGVSEGLAQALKLPYFSNALIKQPGSVRTFQEADKNVRSLELKIKFTALDSQLKDRYVAMGDDSIVRGSVSTGGSVWRVRNSGAKGIEFWVSYGPMFFPSFKEWHKGKECLEELAVHKAFKNDNPYNKSLDEINKAVAKYTNVDEIRYNTKENIEKLLGKGSYQALDASYPIDEKYWPGFIHKEVNRFRKYHNGFN
jgi:amidophosphoribosyltransferase